MVNAAQVQSLNKKIEQINKEGVKVNAQREMLEKQLNTAIIEYESDFGVSIKGKNLSEIKKLVNQEAKKVTEEVEKEYNLKEQVVDAISRGDMETAYELLGIPYKTEESKEGSAESISEVQAEGGEESVDLTPEVKDDSVEDEDDFGFNLSEDSSEESVEKSAESKIPMHSVEESFKGLEVEDNEPKGISVPKGSLVIEDDEGEETSVEGNAPKGGLVVEDDDEEVSDDFGFGDFFAGTKFDI